MRCSEARKISHDRKRWGCCLWGRWSCETGELVRLRGCSAVLLCSIHNLMKSSTHDYSDSRHHKALVWHHTSPNSPHALTPTNQPGTLITDLTATHNCVMLVIILAAFAHCFSRPFLLLLLHCKTHIPCIRSSFFPQLPDSPQSVLLIVALVLTFCC